jgi:hypothetical protein
MSGAHPFAPGAIECHKRQRQELRRWLFRSAAVAAITTLAALAAGYFFGS